ncbi:hypothetical protein K1W69_13160 [Hoeflea sp. WL0058]|uniref:Uncharacterized protein n=1 Tax=Flavimaribacter sediminis TaxID=2865987 RepID=A0AAE3D0U7_9HYPH|nr:hypothetical protein [Flavimaribacter sediminis]MBW8638139.1 hypothetical protein [Flavimaribacter sediminis]
MLEFLRNNADWIFGSGGAVAALLAVYKTIFAGKKAEEASSEGQSASAPPQSVLNTAIVAAAVVAVVGLAFMFASPSETTRANNGSAAVSGDNNQVTISRD